MTTLLESILARLELGDLSARFAVEKIDDALLSHLSDADLLHIGVDKLGDRKRLLAAFREFQPPAPRLPRPSPTSATRENPFNNGLGLPCVPIPGYATLFCIWQVRVKDFLIYCE